MSVHRTFDFFTTTRFNKQKLLCPTNDVDCAKWTPSLRSSPLWRALKSHALGQTLRDFIGSRYNAEPLDHIWARCDKPGPTPVLRRGTFGSVSLTHAVHPSFACRLGPKHRKS